MTGPTLTLTATVRATGVDARRGVVRLHPEVLTALGLRAGDAVTLIGNRTTAGIAAVAAAGASRALLYADDLLLGNLGCRDGGQVQVSPAPRVAAHRVTVAGPVELQAAVSPDMLRLAMLGKVISAGDDVSLLPQDVLPDASAGRLIAAARASLRNTVGFAWTSALVTVIAADPPHAGLVTMDTVVGWAGGQVTHSTATPLGVRPLAATSDQGAWGATGPAVAQPPGLRSADDYAAGDDGVGADDASADDERGAAPARSESDGPGVRSGTAGSRTLPHGVVPAGTEPAPSLDDLPGLRTQANQLIELLDLGFHHAEVLGRLGTSITLGALVTGPSGSGKSAMVRAVAADVGATVSVVWAPEVAALTNNDAAARLRSMASTVAQQVAAGRPAVLLISDVESVVPRNGESSGVEATPLATVFRQTVGDVLRSGAAVVCTTSRPESVDPALRTPGLLDHEIVVPLPDAVGRRDQLGVLTRQMPLAADVRLDDLAARTPGFVAADLAALVREAGVRAALRHRATVGSSAGATAEVTNEAVTSEAVANEAVANEAVANEAVTGEAVASVGLADFMAALEVVRPTSMAESTLELAKVTLDDVGDMTDVKQVLTEAILWPLTYPDTFARLGIEPPRGVLLYGPPGCGKTYLVKAIAGSGKSNVLSVKGAELLSKWVGDSERAVRELFRRARDAAPTLIFFDEVDALAPLRGQSTDGGTTDRVVASLLTELDGVEPMRNVVVIGATNRPDLVDSALLRPGRLERLVYVPPPDAAARAEILRAAAKSVPLDDDVNLDELAGELDGFSAADCTALIREAALAAMRESLDAATVTAANVTTARTRVRPSLDPVQVAALAAYATTHTPRT